MALSIDSSSKQPDTDQIKRPQLDPQRKLLLQLLQQMMQPAPQGGNPPPKQQNGGMEVMA